MQKISPSYAVLVGTAWVNLPVLAIMFGGWGGILFLAAVVVRKTAPLGTFGAVAVIAAWILVPWVLAWTWWSVNVPKWRLWAMARTDDWETLNSKAIASGLVWNDDSLMGRLFSRTEIWSQRQRDKLNALKNERL